MPVGLHLWFENFSSEGKDEEKLKMQGPVDIPHHVLGKLKNNQGRRHKDFDQSYQRTLQNIRRLGIDEHKMQEQATLIRQWYLGWNAKASWQDILGIFWVLYLTFAIFISNWWRWQLFQVKVYE